VSIGRGKPFTTGYQKAELQPADDVSPDHVTLDETVVRINGQQYWLYAGVNPETNKSFYMRLFTTTTTALTQRFLQELRKKHDVSDAVFLIDHAHHLAAALRRAGPDFNQFAMEIGMLSNVSFGK